jgi:hypothetical protein
MLAPLPGLRDRIHHVWFKVLSLLIAAVLLAKATIALAAPRRFYDVRQRQYATEALPPKLLVAPVLVLGLTAVAAYAAVFHYRPWGWVVLAFLILLSVLALDHALRWKSHRLGMLKVVASPKVWQVDCALLALGATFAALAVFVY